VHIQCASAQDPSCLAQVDLKWADTQHLSAGINGPDTWGGLLMRYVPLPEGSWVAFTWVGIKLRGYLAGTTQLQMEPGTLILSYFFTSLYFYCTLGTICSCFTWLIAMELFPSIMSKLGDAAAYLAPGQIPQGTLLNAPRLCGLKILHIQFLVKLTEKAFSGCPFPANPRSKGLTYGLF
jgi:hypothetical protein